MHKDDLFEQFLIEKIIIWINEKRSYYRPLAGPLDEALIKKFSPYFDEKMLREVRVYLTKSLPQFDFLDEFGFTDFTKKAMNLEYKKGVIFFDTFVISISSIDIYELIIFYLSVHMTLYKKIGLKDFITKYVKQSLELNFNTREILIEKLAERLTDRYEKGEVFDVSKEIEKYF